MPLNRYVVRVDPQGQTVTVDVRDTSGVSAAVFESSQFDAAARTLPLVITSQTDFWLRAPGPYDVSCLVGGAEVAAAGAPKRVEVSDVPVLVVPDWERQRTAAASGGGSAPVRFIGAGLYVNSGARSFSSLDTYWPVLADPVVGPVFASLPVKVEAGQEVSDIHIKVPNDGGADVTINYAELTVTNQDATEVLTVYTNADVVIAAGETHYFSLAELDGSYAQVGTDLTFVDVGGTGSIYTTAGGVFSAQFAFDITPPV